MDAYLRDLERRYQKGDGFAGLRLLQALVRSGIIPERNIFLAAAYKFPLALKHLQTLPKDILWSEDLWKRQGAGLHPKEENILPLDADELVSGPGWSGVTDWDQSIYVRRGLAAVICAYKYIMPKILDLPVTNENEISRIRRANNSMIDAHQIVSQWLEGNLEGGSALVNLGIKPGHRPGQSIGSSLLMRILSNVMPLHTDPGEVEYPEIHYLASATSAVLWNIREGLAYPNKIAGGATLSIAHACYSMALLDEKFGNRSVPGPADRNFGPEVMKMIFESVSKTLVPILLDPFPII